MTSFSNLQNLAIGYEKAVDTAGKSAIRSARPSQAATCVEHRVHYASDNSSAIRQDEATIEGEDICQLLIQILRQSSPLKSQDTRCEKL